MKNNLYLVDAFTSRPFAGNPAAVCLMPDPADPAWMLAVAAEMKHSETAFLTPNPQGFGLRWFTPLKEVRLCGHATLASAHVLWQTGLMDSRQPACFNTLSGRLTAIQLGDWIEIDFPARSQQPAGPPERLAEVLGASPLYVGSKARPIYWNWKASRLCVTCSPTSSGC